MSKDKRVYDCYKKSDKGCKECGCYKTCEGTCGKHETYRKSKENGCKECGCTCGCD